MINEDTGHCKEAGKKPEQPQTQGEGCTGSNSVDNTSKVRTSITGGEGRNESAVTRSSDPAAAGEAEQSSGVEHD